MLRQLLSPSPITDESFIIEGGQRLEGTTRVSGAKNAALPMMAASLLTDEEVVLHDVPDIEDVRILANLLRLLGAKVDRQSRSTVVLRADAIHTFSAPSELVRKMRASFLVMGPLLARFGQAESCAPGGDVIGQRPIDVHLTGFASLGAKIARNDQEVYRAVSPRLRGTRIFLDYPSHIGTENLLMAACLAEGTSVLVNASQEPEVVDLAHLLMRMGARISGAGTSYLTVEGVGRLHGAEHRVIPDRIEAGTYAIAAALTGGPVQLSNVDCSHLESLVWKLREAGVTVREGENEIIVASQRPLMPVNVQALPYPGFATDLQSCFGVLLTQAPGHSVMHERVYERRLLYLRELRRLGAKVKARGQTAVFEGPCHLVGTTVRALDIRSGSALILAGLIAEGETRVTDIQHLDRGYQDMDLKLRSLSARIRRTFSTV